MKEKTTIQVTLNKEDVDQVLAILAKDEAELELSDVIETVLKKIIIDDGILDDGGVPFNRNLFYDVISDRVSEVIENDNHTPVLKIKTREDLEKFMNEDEDYEDLDGMTVDEYMKLYGNPDGK